MTQLLQEALLPHTHNLYLENCVPSWVHQIIARLCVEKATWDQELRLIEKLANERDAICEAILQLLKS